MRIGPGLRIIGSLVVLCWAMCGAVLAAQPRMALEDIGYLPAEVLLFFMAMASGFLRIGTWT